MDKIERPLDFLNNMKGRKVLVSLKEGKILSGTLLAFDIHINLVLDNTKEIFDDLVTDVHKKKNKNIGLIFCRGDNIIYVSPGENDE